MITTLTKEQELKIPEYFKLGLDSGLRTKETNREEAKKAINFLYELIGKKVETILFFDSPLACNVVINLLKNLKGIDNHQLGTPLRNQLDSQLDNQLDSQLSNQLGTQLDTRLDNQLGNQVWSQLWNRLWSQLRNQLDNQLGGQLWNQLRNQLWNQLYSQLDSQLENQIRNQLDSQLSNQLGTQLDSQLDNQLDNQIESQLRSQLRNQLPKELTKHYFDRSSLWQGYYRFYQYILEVLFPEKIKDFPLLYKLLHFFDNVHGVCLFENIAIVCEYPELISMKDARTHNESDMCVKYRDGFGWHALNGIVVPKEIALLKPEEITKDIILKQENADIRREIVRKLSSEQLINVLDAKVLDKQTIKLKYQELEYELLDIDLGDKRIRPYLKMVNPSINTVHVEGVHPDCKNVMDALKYRNESDELPMIVS